MCVSFNIHYNERQCTRSAIISICSSETAPQETAPQKIANIASASQNTCQPPDTIGSCVNRSDDWFLCPLQSIHSLPCTARSYKTALVWEASKNFEFSPCRTIFRQILSRNSDRKSPVEPGCHTVHRSKWIFSASVAEGLVPLVVGPTYVYMYVYVYVRTYCMSRMPRNFMHKYMY